MLSEEDCFWPCDADANIYYDELLVQFAHVVPLDVRRMILFFFVQMYCRPENVLYWSNRHTYRTGNYDKCMKKRKADEDGINTYEGSSRRSNSLVESPPKFTGLLQCFSSSRRGRIDSREKLFAENSEKKSTSFFSLL